jgi:predicted enzyme related to lactoylglutathione lyase
MTTSATTPKAKGLAASYYFAKDLDRATAFYQELFGFEPSLAVPGMVSEWTFPTGESFGLYRPQDEANFKTSHGLIFEFDDIEAAVAGHKARGVEFEDDGKIEETPGCFMAFAKDSEGNDFILHKRK